MKFSAISLLGSLITGASAFQNYLTADNQLNISSPLFNGVYAAGQVIPLSYTPLNAGIVLNIYIKGADPSVLETAIVLNADTTDNPTYHTPVKIGDITYYKHSINYAIPTAYPAGNYECIFENAISRTNTSIPVSFLAYVAPEVAPPVPAASDTSITITQPPSA